MPLGFVAFAVVVHSFSLFKWDFDLKWPQYLNGQEKHSTVS